MFPQIFGKYVLERELASGGMARVYLATLRGAVGFEKRLVVKQIRPELALDEAFVKRFVEEAKIAVELSHPNIVPVYELGVEQGTYYIAMELCEGVTLTEVLMETGPLDAAEGAYVGIEICRALDYAHRRAGIVHRDVTPRNVLLDEEGAVRLIDFGIAAPVSGARDSECPEVFGSPGHMPPEQIRGERLTPATDVFAVGALLIEAWTGRPPFRRGSFQASADALNELPAPLDREHPELAPVSDIIAQAVAAEVAERPRDAESLARKLRDFSRQFDSGDVAKRVGRRVRGARKRQQSPSPWLAGGSSGPMTPTAAPALAGPGPVTRTFAARDDLVEWTRKIASEPPAAAEQGQPPAPSRVSSSTPPSLIEADEPATRALPRASAPPPRGLVRGLASLSILAAGVAAVGLGASRGRESPAAPPSAVARRALPAQPALPNPSVAPPVASTPSRAVPAESARPVPARGSPSAALARPAPELVASSAVLRLTADPIGASVSVVGPKVSETQITPVHGLKLPPGSYSVTFRSPTFAQPVVARVELIADGTRSVHADFRAAEPTVLVR